MDTELHWRQSRSSLFLCSHQWRLKKEKALSSAELPAGSSPRALAASAVTQQKFSRSDEAAPRLQRRLLLLAGRRAGRTGAAIPSGGMISKLRR